MKRLIFWLFLSLTSSGLLAQYSTPGTGVKWDLDTLASHSSGVVVFSAGYFQVNSDITISPNDTLWITTDETVKVAQAKRINVHGTLIATPPVQLTFTAIDTTQRFKGFRFENSSGSIMIRTLVEFGGGIKLVSSPVHFEDCVIRFNDKSNCTGSIDASQSNPVIKRCTFFRNAGPAVATGANAASSPQILGCQILYNNTANTNAPQINLGMMGSDTIRIIGNLIDGAYPMAGGIALSTLAGGNVIARVDSNTIVNNRYGIACIGSNIQSIIRYNIIMDNNTQGIPAQGGSGLNFNGGATNVSRISHNEISGNLWGATIQGTAAPNFGQVEPDTLNIGLNKFFNNGNSGSPYNLYNNTPNSIKAENNFWGSYAIDTVENTIFHQPDDPALGLVDYIPISSMTTGTGQGMKPEINQPLVDVVFPNPASHIVYIKLSEACMSGSHQGKLYLIDKAGRTMHHQMIPAYTRELSLDVSGIMEGLYFIRAEYGTRKEIRSLVIIK